MCIRHRHGTPRSLSKPNGISTSWWSYGLGPPLYWHSAPQGLAPCIGRGVVSSKEYWIFLTRRVIGMSMKDLPCRCQYIFVNKHEIKILVTLSLRGHGMVSRPDSQYPKIIIQLEPPFIHSPFNAFWAGQVLDLSMKKSVGSKNYGS